MKRRPLVLCILDGIGCGRRDAGDAVYLANTPTLDRLLAQHPTCELRAHGTAVGMPSDKDMGNSEVGHNAMGAGRVFDQGAKLVELAIESGRVWKSAAWQNAMGRGRNGGTLHLLGLLSDGRVHSHVDHLQAMLRQAEKTGVQRIRVHILTDGRDVSPRSALTWIRPLEQQFQQMDIDIAFASGGGRMRITMDRYDADWPMVERGWQCHVRGQGRRFDSAGEAIETLYAELPESDDQWLPPFVVGDFHGMQNGDAVLFFNYRGDRAIQISRAFDEGPDFDKSVFDRGPQLDLSFAGMMEYDGDLRIPQHYLVAPPAIDGTVGEQMAQAGLRTMAIAETQKFGHVTYFFNGNRSETLPGEDRLELPSDTIPFDQRPEMKAIEATDQVIECLQSGTKDFVRVNLANGDMVGHTGNLNATIQAVEILDQCLARLNEACQKANAVLIVTADHGNAEQMFAIRKDKNGFELDAQEQPVPSTKHTLNPVPFILVDHLNEWQLSHACKASPGIAQIGATLLDLAMLPIPSDYLPTLVERRIQP